VSVEEENIEVYACMSADDTSSQSIPVPSATADSSPQSADRAIDICTSIVLSRLAVGFWLTSSQMILLCKDNYRHQVGRMCSK